MSKTNILIHTVFCTKARESTITPQYKEHLYRFIWKTLHDNKCYLYRMGGIENHLHLLIDLNPCVALSDLMRDIKSSSSGWMQHNPMFPNFRGWAREYFAASLSIRDKDSVVEYIKSQEEHHKRQPLDEEFKRLCEEEGFVLYVNDFY